MRNLLLVAIFICTFLYSFSQSLSPEVVSSAGDYYDNGNVSLSWTVGECVIETFNGSTAILTQGFQQSKLTVTQVENREIISFDCFVYPNPVKDILNVDIEGMGENANISLEVFTMDGKMIFQREVSAEQTTIDFSKYNSATYILKLHDNSNKVNNVYQIVKTN